MEPANQQRAGVAAVPVAGEGDGPEAGAGNRVSIRAGVQYGEGTGRRGTLGRKAGDLAIVEGDFTAGSGPLPKGTLSVFHLRVVLFFDCIITRPPR